jgi:hypothetical protein
MGLVACIELLMVESKEDELFEGSACACGQLEVLDQIE